MIIICQLSPHTDSARPLCAGISGVLRLDARGCHARCSVYCTSQPDGSQFRLRSHISSRVPKYLTDGTSYGLPNFVTDSRRCFLVPDFCFRVCYVVVSWTGTPGNKRKVARCRLLTGLMETGIGISTSSPHAIFRIYVSDDLLFFLRFSYIPKYAFGKRMMRYNLSIRNQKFNGTNRGP